MNKFEINDCLFELQNLATENIISIDKVHWWLLKHEELRKYCKANWNKNSISWDLPDFETAHSLEYHFFFFYYHVSVIVDESQYEEYCRIALQEYKEVKDSQEMLIEWVKKHHEAGIEKLGMFLLDHLDYIGDGSEYHLGVFHLYFSYVEIYVDRKDFVSIIDFIDLYSTLFYVDELCPEGLEKITKEFQILENNTKVDLSSDHSDEW